MNTAAKRADCAAVYAQLLETVYPASQPLHAPDFSREELTELWQEVRWGQQGTTQNHGGVRLIDIGTPNPLPEGPAILRAEIECDGERLRGDVALNVHADDWEAKGCGESDTYRNTVLHVVLQAPAETWYTRTADHREVPVWVIPPDRLRAVCGCARLYPEAEKAPLPIAPQSDRCLEDLLLTAAAYRAEQKARTFEQKAAVIGREQAWWEAWAEVLGYSANKRAMCTLARRVPIAALQSEDAEAILLGTAGFLQAVLPERTTEEARAYHRRAWEAWWQQRECFVPNGMPPLPWVLSPVRPMNHPTRRVAALAVSARHWDELQPLMNVASAKRLIESLGSLSHPFWDTHCTLAAAPLRRKYSLVGSTRAADFLANFIYPLDEADSAWAAYLTIRTKDVPKQIEQALRHLTPERNKCPVILNAIYRQQGMFQLMADFRILR